MKQPDKCPRCGGGWADIREQGGLIFDADCSHCTMTIRSNTAAHSRPNCKVFRFKFGHNDVVCWYVDYAESMPDQTRYRGKTLPLLPFTVSKDDLEKYLILV